MAETDASRPRSNDRGIGQFYHEFEFSMLLMEFYEKSALFTPVEQVFTASKYNSYIFK